MLSASNFSREEKEVNKLHKADFESYAGVIALACCGTKAVGAFRSFPRWIKFLIPGRFAQQAAPSGDTDLLQFVKELFRDLQLFMLGKVLGYSDHIGF